MDDSSTDATRRAVLAALIGGVALATPPGVEGKQKGKQKKKPPKPPLAAAVVRISNVTVLGPGAEQPIVLEYEAAIVQLDTGGTDVQTNLRAALAGGAAETMRASLVRQIQQNVVVLLGGGIAADRVAVLIV